MRRFRLPTILVGVLLGMAGFLAAPGICLACSCALPPSAEEARSRSTVVFRGRVTALETVRSPSGWQYQRVTLRADTSWQGQVTQQMTIYTGSGGGDCGFPFAQGESYLVYASAVGENGPSGSFPAGSLATGICSRTRTIDRAADDLAALGLGTPVAQTPLPTLPNTGDGFPPTLSFSSTPSLLALALLATVLLGVGVTQRGKKPN